MRWGFLWTLLVALVVSRPALTHEPLEEARRRTVVPASRLDAMVHSLQKLARTVVTDLNDDVNAISLQAETLQRQRWLQAENQSAGFGMPRWPQEQFDAALERATAAAADVWERYRQRLTWLEVTFGPSGTSVTPPSRSFECLVGRSEALVVQINNQTRQGLNVQVRGEAGDTPIRASQTFVPPNSTECACVLVTVYVYCGDGLDYSKWVDNLAAGRTFVSSGAMLVLEVDGQPIGSTIALEPGQPREVVVKGWARCRSPLQRVEIVHNGQVIRTVHPPQPSRDIQFEETVTIDGPGWLAARTQAGTQMTWWGHDDVAHTGPIYITAGDKQLIKTDAVDRLIEVVKAGRAAAASSNMYASEQQKAGVLEYFDEGIEKYQQLRRQTR